MAKIVTAATETHRDPTFGMEKHTVYVGCDDGSTYVFERSEGSPRYVLVARFDADGTRTQASRVPRYVAAHMDGRTGSGPRGPEGEFGWTA